MKASRCTCGKTYALDRENCPICGRSMTSIEIADNAELLTFTILNTVPEGFEGPIFLALAELELGVHLLCECKYKKDLEIGRKGRIVDEAGKQYFVGSIE